MISTLAFALRWQFVPFVGGLVIALLAAYGLAIWQPDPQNMEFSSFVGMYGRPLNWTGLIAGLSCVAYAWFKASMLRNG